MNKTKIDWCDSTWNPVTGCYHGCEYCYARNQTHRFGAGWETASENLPVLDEPVYGQRIGKDGKPETRKEAYPYDFIPTFHRYHLNDYIGKKGRNIFVCSMADLFGKWVPDEWIQEVFAACEKAPQHNYLFLTKNPNGVPKSSHIYNNIFGNHSANYWFGASITCQKDLENRLWQLLQVRGHSFLSIEPLLDKLDLECIWVAEKRKEVMLSLPKKIAYYFGGGQPYHMPEWIIIGAETGRRKDKVIPKKEWIEDIVNGCRKAEIPIFMKSSLTDIWGEPLIQEFPEGLQRTGCKKMKLVSEGVDVYCGADDDKRSPFDIVECPIGGEVCAGPHCLYYHEKTT